MPLRLVSSGSAVRRIVAGEHEAARIQLDARGCEPVGVRLGADEREQVADRPASRLPVCRSRQDTPSSSPSAPSSSVISQPMTTSILGCASIRSMRYCDMVSLSGRRAMSVTRLARLARKTVAWPAELPPPTSATSWSGAKVGFQRRGPIMDRRAFELLEPLDIQPPIARAGRDHDGARLGPLAGWQLHVARIVAAFELHRLVGDRDLDPELLRLAEGAAHQRHAGNAGREAEIILDPRRGAGLPAERAAVDRKHGKPFRTRHRPTVARPAGPGADDDDVVKLVRCRSGRPARRSVRAGPRSDCAAAARRDKARSASSSGVTLKRSTSVCAQLSSAGSSCDRDGRCDEGNWSAAEHRHCARRRR